MPDGANPWLRSGRKDRTRWRGRYEPTPGASAVWTPADAKAARTAAPELPEKIPGEGTKRVPFGLRIETVEPSRNIFDASTDEDRPIGVHSIPRSIEMSPPGYWYELYPPRSLGFDPLLSGGPAWDWVRRSRPWESWPVEPGVGEPQAGDGLRGRRLRDALARILNGE